MCAMPCPTPRDGRPYGVSHPRRRARTAMRPRRRTGPSGSPRPDPDDLGPPMTAGTLCVTAEPRPGHRVRLRCLGSIDHEAGPELSRYIQHWVEVSCCVVLDLSGVDRLDASGLSALMIGLHHAERRDGHLRLGRRPSPAADRLLARSGVRTVFEDADAARPCPHRCR